MKRLLTIGSAALAATVAFGDVVYENDFSTRTSEGAVPYAGWREQPYVTGKFVNSNVNAPFDDGDIQDGWILSKGFNQCPVTIFDENGNQEMVFYRPVDTTPQIALVKQRIGNAFTTGTVVAQCDVRVPSAWFANGQATFTLGDESFFSPEVSHNDSLTYRVAQVGIIQDSEGLKFWHRGKSANVKESGVNPTHWYRLVIVVYINDGFWHCRIHDLGTEHPTLDTPTPETTIFTSSLGLAIPYDNADNSRCISSFSLDGFYPGGSTSAEGIANAILFDNVRIWHNDVECYANDFNVRRSRVIGGTTAATYDANGHLVTNTVGTEVYAVGANLQAPRVNNATITQPDGLDGWRRINYAGANTFSISATDESGGGSNPSAYCSYTSFSLAAHPIGTTLTNGKVRLSADFRSNNIGGTTGKDNGVSVALGSDEFYNGTYDDYRNGILARAGLCAESKVVNGKTHRRPIYFTDMVSDCPEGDDDWVWQGTWLRLIIEVDLEEFTYSFEFHEQGSHPAANAADGPLVYSHPIDLAPYMGVVEISCFALIQYGSVVWFDNVKVWHTAPGESSAKLIYENDFSSRKICYEDFRESSLIGTLARNPVGQDGWTRADKQTTKASLRNDGENTALAFGNTSGNPAYAVHDIGALYKSGEMTTQIDAKPPKYWVGSSRGTFFWLGGDRFHEGNRKSGGEFWTYAATFFGFRDAVGRTANNVYTNVSFCAYNGNGTGGGAYVNSSVAVDPTHWYRFVAKTSIRDGESDIAVYDLGTEHPTLATATPAAPVETFTGIKFRRAPDTIKGLSSLCLLAQGTADNTLDKTVGAFWDNIRIEHQKDAFMIIVR